MRNSQSQSIVNKIKLFLAQAFVLVFFTIALQAQNYDNPELVVAEAQGQQLKMKHIVAYMGLKMSMNQMSQNPNDAETEAVAMEAVTVFNTNPIATIQQLDMVAQELGLNGGAANHGTYDSSPQNGGFQSSPSTNFGGNFNMEAELAKFGPNQLDFHSSTSNQLKQLLSGTLLTDSSNTYSSSPNGSHYLSSSTNIHFCANGTFTWVSDASASVSTAGADLYSGGGEDAPVTGYWDVATGGGQTFIMLYSRHPEMLQLNPNGFVPMPVNAFQADLVAVPNVNSKRGEDLYRVNRGQAQCY